MVNNINLPKILIPATSSSGIKALEKKQGDKQDRRFERHLQKGKDDDENNQDGEWVLNNKEPPVHKHKKTRSGVSNQVDHEKNKLGTHEKLVKRIDIIV